MATRYNLPPHIHSALMSVDPYSLDFHAARYDSGELYRQFVYQYQDSGYRNRAAIRAEVRDIARACVDDGADYGFMPCLGGELGAVWSWLCRAFLRIEVR